MGIRQRDDNCEFGGCFALAEHYRTVGSELVAYESRVGPLRSVIDLGRGYAGRISESSKSFKEFSQGVSFVPVEVLESYLEDILDLQVSDQKLSIIRYNKPIPPGYFCLAGMGAALALGGYCAGIGGGLLLSMAVTLFMALPFAVVWYFVPHEGWVRRIGFAHVLSQEVRRRRGIHSENIGGGMVNYQRIVLSHLLAGKAPPSAAMN